MNLFNNGFIYNIYQCETTKEALELNNRKKFNKTILISNVGTNLCGKNSQIKLKKNDVIALFLA